MTSLQLSIVHRLPQNYRWSAGFAGSKVEPIPQNGPCGDNSPVALKLLSPDGDNAWSVMYKLSRALSDIEVPCSVLECEGEPCLFVNRRDEFAATCRLKNFGVAIAEPFSNYNPFLSVSSTPVADAYTPAAVRQTRARTVLVPLLPLSQYDNLMT